MIGNPKFNYGDSVKFKCGDDVYYGTITIIDSYGTFFDKTDVSYDITVGNILFKHINERRVEPRNCSDKWKIVSVTHTGTKGTAGTERTESLYVKWKDYTCRKPERLVDIIETYEDSSSINYNCLYLSEVKKFVEDRDKIVITTLNSVYTLIRMSDQIN